MSSLAAQLAGIQANTNATILDKSKRKKIHSVSLVYEPKEAATQDFESIYHVCMESFRDLESIDKRFVPFMRTLFSETSVRFDRLVQQAEQVQALDQTIAMFLKLISRYLNLEPAIASLEWLIRRFHVHLHNTEDLLLAFLPWYDTTEVFVRVLDVIPLNGFPPLFEFLTTCKKNLKAPSKSTLIRVLTKDRALFTLVNSYVSASVHHQLFFSRLLIFWTSINVWVLIQNKQQSNLSIVDDVLLLVGDMLPLSRHPDCQTAAYIVLVVLSSQFALADDVVAASISTICRSWSIKSQVHGLAAVAQLVQSSGNTPSACFDKVDYLKIAGIPDLLAEILTLQQSHDICLFVTKYCISVLQYKGDVKSVYGLVSQLPELGNESVVLIISAALKSIQSTRDDRNNESLSNDLKDQIIALLEWAAKERPQTVEQALAAARIERDMVELALESSIAWGLDVPTSNGSIESQGDADLEVISAPKTVTRADLETESTQLLRMEEPSSYLVAESPERFAKMQLWVHAIPVVDLTLEERLGLVKVSREHEVSFLASIALLPIPTQGRVQALELLADRLAKEDQDFQGLLPVILVLLSDPAQTIRLGAGKLLRTFENKKADSIYGVDSLYGSKSSGKLIWLSRSELKAVRKQLLARLPECEADESFARETASGAGKSSWMQFLCAHASCCELPQILQFVLDATAGHKGVAKSLLPLLVNYSGSRALWAARCASFKVPFAKFEQSLVASLYSNDEDCINFLCRLFNISKQVQSSKLCDYAGAHVVELWNRQFFTLQSQSLILGSLLESVLEDDADFDAMDVLTSLSLSTENFCEALRQCEQQREYIFTSAADRAALAAPAGNDVSTGPGSATSHEGPIKRRRRRSSSSVQLKDSSQWVVTLAERHLRRFTVILEVLNQACSKIEEPGRLLAQLFGILDELVSLGTDSNLPVLYTEELLADCLIQIVDRERKRLNGAAMPQSSNIRVDVIVSCIRTSTSPQVQNKLLLLVSSLATLVPDLVFHSVMPIFTFMGANTVRLDNDYSAHVIQQTIFKVLPALVVCGDKQEEIEIALRSFVAAFPHIPRHRRNKLFNAIIRTLGPRESLHKLLLLLARKFAEALCKQKYADAKVIRHFTTLFVRSFSVTEQLLALERYVDFIRTAEPADNEKMTLLSPMSERVPHTALLEYLYDFAARTIGHSEILSQTQPLRLQIFALPEFSSENLALCAKLIEMLLRSEKELAAATDSHSDNDNDTTSGAAAGRAAALRLLGCCLEFLPIQQFVTVSIDLLLSSPDKDGLLECDDDVKARILALVATRFEKEPSTSAAAIEGARTLVSAFTTALKGPWQLRQPLIDCLDILVTRFSDSISPDTQLSLLDGLVGSNGLLSESSSDVISAITCINSVAQNLGARVIGHFGRIMPVIFSHVENSIRSSSDSNDIEIASFALISGFINRIPSFMTSPTKRIMELVFMSKCDPQLRARLLELIGEKVDPTTVLTAYVSTWDTALDSGVDTAVSMFLASLDAVIAQSPKKEVMARASQLTGFVLRAFEVRGSRRFNINDVNQIESRVILTAVEMVLKLNDKIFRPLFVRMTRWAFEGEGASSPAECRTTVFFKFFVKLLGRLKSIVTSYFGYVLPYATAILDSDSVPEEPSNVASSVAARKSILQSFVLSFASDQDDFWQAEARFEAALQLLLRQLDRQGIAAQGSLLVKAIVGLAETTGSPDHRKRINDCLAAKLGPESTSDTKLLTIQSLSAIYQRLGDEWVSTLPQLVPLIAELLEDDDENVENEVRRKLVPVIESVLGEPLDRYLS